jgi:hypothetical protein
MTNAKDKTDAPSEARQAVEPELPAGKAKVVIAADFKNPSRVGRTVTLPEEEAEVLVREGRARYVRRRTSEGVVDGTSGLPVVSTVAPPSATA